ncbi:hypothetical protein KKB40_02475 [Patescibacteria group bacterium]|nr:hypothetical protein [Patescibacteria group bacterium]
MKKPIKIEFDYLIDFIKKVISQWVVLLLFLPTLYDFLHVYLPEPIKSFELTTNARNLFMVLAVLVAVYWVWRKEHIDFQTLQEGKTKFTVTPNFFKINIDKHLKQIDEKIKTSEAEIPHLESENIFNHLTVFSRRKTQQSVEDYIKSLREYKNELASFYNKNKNLIGIYIELASDKYDENISVEFILNNSGQMLQADELKCPWQPSPPDRDRLAFINHVDFRERDVYRTNLEHGTNNISCDLRNLKKGRPVYFINEGIYISSTSPKIRFDIQISSRNSDGLQVFSFDKEKTSITKFRDISEIEEFDRET